MITTQGEIENNKDSFSNMFEAENYHGARNGSLLLGIIVDIQRGKVIVNVGLKSEGVISINEFQDASGKIEISEGSVVEVMLKSFDDGLGNTTLSYTEAKTASAWAAMEAAMEAGDVVTGNVISVVNGGVTVSLGFLNAFLPGSLVDIRPTSGLEEYVGKEIDVLVLKMDSSRNSIIVSRKAALHKANSLSLESILSKVEVGAELDGIISGFANYGAFVDLGGVDGLIHISDISWSKLKHPSEKLTIGENITVKVLKYDAEKNRISLGLKQLIPSPWDHPPSELQVGAITKGKVISISRFGIFVNIFDGLEGLAHVSELMWSDANIDPFSIYKVGDEVNVSILEINLSKRRLALSIKQAQDNPWDLFNSGHNAGDKINVVVRKVTGFGIFVGLPGGIDGLIHISDISKNKISEEEMFSKYTKGLELEVVVLSIDTEKERIALGIKQLNEMAKEYNKAPTLTIADLID